MNPGTFYFYEYENNVRKRNAGFLKISRHYQSCSFQVHIKSSNLESALDATMYAFFLDGSQINAKQISVLPVSTQTIAFRFSVSENAFPERRALTDITGFFLNCPESSAFWFTPDLPEYADIGSICFLDDSPAAPDVSKVPGETTADSAPADTNDATTDSALADINDATTDPTPTDVNDAATDPTPTDVDNATAIQTSDITAEEVSPAHTQSFPRKITLSELTVLPRRFWSLSNNSFLLHGCHNYGHLLLAEQNGRLWLGVPGTYDPREARVADLFGFPRFCRSYAHSELLTDCERNETADFGHWFRCVGSATR